MITGVLKPLERRSIVPDAHFVKSEWSRSCVGLRDRTALRNFESPSYLIRSPVIFLLDQKPECRDRPAATIEPSLNRSMFRAALKPHSSLPAE